MMLLTTNQPKYVTKQVIQTIKFNFRARILLQLKFNFIFTKKHC